MVIILFMHYKKAVMKWQIIGVYQLVYTIWYLILTLINYCSNLYDIFVIVIIQLVFIRISTTVCPSMGNKITRLRWKHIIRQLWNEVLGQSLIIFWRKKILKSWKSALSTHSVGLCVCLWTGYMAHLLDPHFWVEWSFGHGKETNFLFFFEIFIFTLFIDIFFYFFLIYHHTKLKTFDFFFKFHLRLNGSFFRFFGQFFNITSMIQRG